MLESRLATQHDYNAEIERLLAALRQDPEDARILEQLATEGDDWSRAEGCALTPALDHAERVVLARWLAGLNPTGKVIHFGWSAGEIAEALVGEESRVISVLEHPGHAIAAAARHGSGYVSFYDRDAFGAIAANTTADEPATMVVIECDGDRLALSPEAALQLLEDGGAIAVLGRPLRLYFPQISVASTFTLDEGGDVRLSTDPRLTLGVALHTKLRSHEVGLVGGGDGSPRPRTTEPPAAEAIEIQDPAEALERAVAAVEEVCPELAVGFRSAFEVAALIPGWLAPQEAAALYRLGHEASGDILELGTYYGKSTFLIAQGMRQAGKSHRIFTTDIHWRGVDEATGRDRVLAEQPVLSVTQLIREHRLEHTVIQILGWSDVCTGAIDLQRIEHVFIDCGHDYESCSKDFRAVMSKLPAGKTIDLLFHDYGPNFPGVQRTIDELVKTEPGFQFKELTHSLFACRMTGRARAARPAPTTEQ